MLSPSLSQLDYPTGLNSARTTMSSPGRGDQTTDSVGVPGGLILISQVLSVQTPNGDRPFLFTGRPNFQCQGIQGASEVKVGPKSTFSVQPPT
jgi:hypothetical protein